LVINLEEDESNCKFATFLKPKKMIGFYWHNGRTVPTKTAKEWFEMSALGKKPENDILKKKNKKTHRKIFSEIIGVSPEKYEPFLRLTPMQRRLANAFLRKHNLKREDIIMGINTGSADRWPKALPISKTVELINNLNKKFNAKIILFGGPAEVERNQQIMEKVSVPVIDAGCDNNLFEFPALLSVCSAVISTDSFGLHASLALKRKTIVLVGPTSPAELDMYGLGEKVIAKSKDICSYKTKTNCMDKISLNEIYSSLKKILDQKTTLIITAFNEPNTIGRAIESALNQKTDRKFDIVVSAPDEPTLEVARSFAKTHQNLSVFKDPGKGKSLALNMLFNKLKSDILILTDGDVYISSNAVEEILNKFEDPEVGCVTGKPVPMEGKTTKYGYWANFLFDSAHLWRAQGEGKRNFIECSGYLFAFRKNKVGEIPLDVAEDTVIPYLFWEKGYRIGYADKAEVYVKNVDNWRDWVKQKTRTSKAHETLHKYVDVTTTPRVKTFTNESKGIINLLTYPKNISQMFWTFQLAIARLNMWGNVFLDTKLKNSHYQDAWERAESTK
jgi:ADP-heptose:LPS heptosyltransferase/glycosyltransferase involved in cell wall biosynthesis